MRKAQVGSGRGLNLEWWWRDGEGEAFLREK